jgi:hypothetical protein
MNFNLFDEEFFDDRQSSPNEFSFCSMFRGNNDILFNDENQSFNKEYYLKGNQLNSFYENPSEDNENPLNFENVSKIQNEDRDIINEHKITNEKEEEKEGSTKPSSDKKGNSKIEKGMFKSQKEKKQIEWRMDYTKKHWKTRISDYAKEEINKYITESDLPKELKNLIHSPHSKKFSANPVVTANYKFLKYNLFQIFTIGKEDGKLQRQNEENITKIFEYIEKVGYDNISQSLRKIKNFFEMSYEDLIRKFYDSYEFIDFKNDETTIFYDEGVKKQEKFSLLKDYGLIKLFKMIQKKRKRD